MDISKKLAAIGFSLALIIGVTPKVNALSVNNIEVIKGQERYQTAGMIADRFGNYETAILVNSDNSLADGLSASGLSGTVDAPILLVKKDSIPSDTLNRLNKVKKVYLVGATSAISTTVENQLKSLGKEVERLGGATRYETSYKVAKEISEIKKVDKVILTNGYKGEADAMSVSPVAARDGVPIILTDGQSIPFDGKSIESYVIGGSTIMNDKLVQNTNSTRLGGEDRFDTNKKVIEKFYNNPTEFYLSKAYQLVDALTVSPLAKNTPVVLVAENSNKTILNGATKLTALGGVDEVSLYQSAQATNGVFITQNMEVHFINVGQGDAIYIELGDGTDILIDAGVENQGSTVVNYLKNQEKDIDLEYLIATHPDADHIGGMQQVFKDLNVKNFYYPMDAPSDTQTWKNVLSLANSEGCKILDAKSGTTLNLGGASIKFIQPDKDYTDNNDDSVVALLDYLDREIVLTGDAESQAETDMINSGVLVDVDVLKVGHHGSDSSSTDAFLKKVKAEDAVISVGSNSYGHPTSNVLNRLISNGSKVWRTDKNGNIVVKSNGKNLTFNAIGSPQTTIIQNSTGNTGGTTQTPQVTKVYVTPSGKSYHSTKNCTALKRSTTILEMTKDEAIKQGKSDPCNLCVK